MYIKENYEQRAKGLLKNNGVQIKSIKNIEIII